MKKPFSELKFSREYFIFLFPVFFVFNGFTKYYPLISFSIASKLLLIYLSVFVALNFILYFIFRDWRKASVYNLWLMCWFFLFGIFHDFMRQISGNLFISKYIFIIPLLLVSLFVVFIYLRRSDRKFNRLTRYVNVLLLVFIAVDIFNIAFFKKRRETAPTSLIGTRCNDCTNPDIYLIVADEYAGRKELNDLFRFDNTDFEDKLRERGFRVLKDPKSNYNYTAFSVASLLSMDYLHGIADRNSDPESRNICYRQINRNSLTEFLSTQGYTFVNHSLFDFADIPASVDNMFFQTREKLITSHTLFGRIKRDLWYHLITTLKLRKARRNYVNFQLRMNEKLYGDTKTTAEKKSAKPRFIYTHLYLPHGPYIFDRDGNMLDVDTILSGNHDDPKLYTDYLLYSNKKYLELIDHILKYNTSPPIIILISDHGFREFKYPVDSLYNFATINNIYLPRKNYEDFYDTMSNVNQFRVLLNTQFDQKIPLLKDSTCWLKE